MSYLILKVLHVASVIIFLGNITTHCNARFSIWRAMPVRRTQPGRPTQRSTSAGSFGVW